MRIIINSIKGYVLEPDWVAKVQQKIDTDIQLIDVYLSEFYIEELKISTYIKKDATCEISYLIKLKSDSNSIDTFEFHLNFSKLRNFLLLSWDRLNYTIGENYNIFKGYTNKCYLEIHTQLLNLDAIQLYNVFGTT